MTHWDGYDTHYTERYMGTPESNPEGYRESSVMASIDRLEGSLLIVHGLIDENVHFRHTARLLNSLIRARKPYELLLFPKRTPHAPEPRRSGVHGGSNLRVLREKSLEVQLWLNMVLYVILWQARAGDPVRQVDRPYSRPPTGGGIP